MSNTDIYGDTDPFLGPPSDVDRQRMESDQVAPGFERDYPVIRDDREFSLLQPGALYIGPDGKRRKKAWEIKSDDDFTRVPEGDPYIGPDKVMREKYKYEGVDLGTQILYDMALTNKERRLIMERAYGKKNLKEEDGKIFAEDAETGVRYAPGSGNLLKRGVATVASAASPAIWSVIGSIGLGAAGTLAAPGPGTTVGAFTGAISGGMLGQSFNDLILKVAGVFDRTPMEEFGNIGVSGLLGAAGMGVGRGLASVMGIKKGISEAAGQAAPRIAGKILGADVEALERAESIRQKVPGTLVRPSAVFKEAPMLHLAAEVFDPTFRKQEVLKQSADKFRTEMIKKEATSLEEEAARKGIEPVKRPESYLNPLESVSSQQAGAALMQRAANELVEREAESTAASTFMRRVMTAGAESKSEEFTAALAGYNAAEASTRKAADDAIKLGFKAIEAEVEAAMKISGSGHNSGDLWRNVGEKIQGMFAAIRAHAENRYTKWDQTFGHLPADTSWVTSKARDFLDSLPDTFKSKHPSFVKDIEAWAGKIGEDGKIIQEPAQITLGQAHKVRNYLRSNVDWDDLPSSIRNGSFKYFSGAINELLHDKNLMKIDQRYFRAAKILDDIDAFYKKNMQYSNDAKIKSIVRALEGGLPADPQILAEAILKEGRTDLINKVRKLVGPNLWSGVRAADIKAMLDHSLTHIPGEFDGKRFAAAILDRVRDGRLKAVHGPHVSENLTRHAQNIEMLDGRLPIIPRDGDTVVDLIEKAIQARNVAQEAARKDPMRTLTGEIKQMESAFRKYMAATGQSIRRDPLGFLYNPTVGATSAAEKILRSPDLIQAVAARFGKDSPEFTMLRHVYANRFLRDPKMAAKLAAESPEIQSLMFPGTKLSAMHEFAKDIEFLAGQMEDLTGASIAATTRVTTPLASIPFGKLLRPLKMIPGVDMSARMALTKYYQLLTWGSTNPIAQKAILDALKGTPEERAIAIEITKGLFRRGGKTRVGTMGAAGAEYLHPGIEGDTGTAEPSDIDVPGIGAARRGSDGLYYAPTPGGYSRVGIPD